MSIKSIKHTYVCFILYDLRTTSQFLMIVSNGPLQEVSKSKKAAAFIIRNEKIDVSIYNSKYLPTTFVKISIIRGAAQKSREEMVVQLLSTTWCKLRLLNGTLLGIDNQLVCSYVLSCGWVIPRRYNAWCERAKNVHLILLQNSYNASENS